MNLQPTIIKLLNNRGVSSQEEIDEFLSEKPQKTYDPFLLHNMEEGVDLILSAIDSDEKICIYGDYDADGITSTSILLEVLSKLTDKLSYYIPSRFEEGYGLNSSAIKKIKDDGFDLIVTVDCGSVSIDEVEYAKELGLKILVTDHHTITDKKADCLIINPKQAECNYPCQYLAGCGVAFKLAQAIITVTGLPKSVLTRTLDLVGIGTIGDIVPLLDENRTLAKYGIRAVNTNARSSLKGLIEGAGLNPGNITSENISFVIVPHLNAAGRIKDAAIAVEMLESDNPEIIAKDVGELLERNISRKNIQNKTFEVCKNLVYEKYRNDDFILIELEDGHEGITGIVAGKIKETFDRPVAIVTPTKDGCHKGTCRSIDGINMYELLKENEDLVVQFGGHSAACGFTVKTENVDKLRAALNASADKIIECNPEIINNQTKAELFLNDDDINMELVEQLEVLEPCGAGNPRPIFEFNGVPMRFQKMGKQNQYRKFTAVLNNGREIPCLIWNNGEQYDEILQKNQKISIIGALGSKVWNGRKSIQFTVEAIKE